MSDPELVLDILSSTLIAIQRIECRFQGIEEPDDFVVSNDCISLPIRFPSGFQRGVDASWRNLVCYGLGEKAT